MAIFAEATENECINDRHCQRTATYISAITDPPYSVVSLQQLSYTCENCSKNATFDFKLYYALASCMLVSNA